MSIAATDGSRPLEGQIVLVTGGARGLGAAVCRRLARSRAVVVVADLRSEQAEQLAQELRDHGLRAHSCALDLRDESQVLLALDEVIDEHARIDVLINNAGMDVTKSVEELSLGEWDEVFAVNLRAPFLISKHVFPMMRAQGGGHIVNVSSTAALRAWANASAYHASKWGLLGLSHALHVEGRCHNIRVTALIAGGMRTPFLLDRFPDIDQAKLQDPENVADAIRFVLMQPKGTVIPELMVLPENETSWP